MHYTDPKRLDAKVRAIEDALSRIGEPITEAYAKRVAALEDCECKNGMFALATSRRQLLSGTGLHRPDGLVRRFSKRCTLLGRLARLTQI